MHHSANPKVKSTPMNLPKEDADLFYKLMRLLQCYINQQTTLVEGISTPADIEGLSSQCRFRDCQHMTEPGCAVQKAILAEELDEDRLGRWRKLVAENERNSMSVAEARSKDKNFGKTIKEALAHKKKKTALD